MVCTCLESRLFSRRTWSDLHRGCWRSLAIIFSTLLFAEHLLLARAVPVTETLLDTTTVKGDLNWRTEPDNNGDTTRGWSETSSVLMSTSNPWRVYQACSINRQTVDNRLFTPFIRRGDANKLHIEVNFTMRDCTAFKQPAELQQCKETFVLEYAEANGARMPDRKEFEAVDTVAADKKWSSQDQGNLRERINSKTLAVTVTQDGVYFAFRDLGACIMLLSIKVYAISCPATTMSFVHFGETPSGPTSSSIKSVAGKCVQHSTGRPQTAICKSDGDWNFPFSGGGCACSAGHQPSGEQKCIECQPGTYKSEVSNDPCKACPAHSHSRKPASRECACDKGFYRATTDPPGLNCSRPPSRVRRLQRLLVEQTRAVLQWDAPLQRSSRKDLSYEISCPTCSKDVHYSPRQRGFNTTRVEMGRLRPNTHYRVLVYAVNGVSSFVNKSGVAITFTTQEAVPHQVTSIRPMRVGRDFIFLSWPKPAPLQSRIELYELQYYPRFHSQNVTSIYPKHQNVTLVKLRLNTEYAIQVRGKTQRGWGEFSKILYVKTGEPAEQESLMAGMNPTGIIVASVISVIVCLLIVVLMGVLFFRRHKTTDMKEKPPESDCGDILDYQNSVLSPSPRAVAVSSPIPHWPESLQHQQLLSSIGRDGKVMHSSVAVPSIFPVSHVNRTVKSYVDPHTYEDPHEAVREFTREIAMDNITIECVIGAGEFGEVCKGKLHAQSGKPAMTVAIKTLKQGASDKNKMDFLTEASIMGQFDHMNVIYLQGVVTKSSPVMIITEFMENGSLDVFLRKNDGKLTILQLVGMLRGISSGMQYLSEMGYVHRDLAARNILVDEKLVCKVADFGLSRIVNAPVDSSDGAYTTKGGKIPVRWTAPEAIAYRKFTSASDMWSYGVVMWEVISYGEHPYWDWSNQVVIRSVEQGYRLPPPMGCPSQLYQLMQQCWKQDRVERPKFAQVVRTLDKLIRSPEQLTVTETSKSPLIPYGLNPFASVEYWLASLKLEMYTDNFLQQGFTTLYQVSQMTQEDLALIGVTLLGHQKKLAQCIAVLQCQLSGSFNPKQEAFLV